MPDHPPDGHPIDRRHFVGRATAAAAVAFAPLAPLKAAAGRARAPVAPVPSAPLRVSDLDEITIAELSEGMVNGRWTARTIVATYLDAIARIDRGGPALHSILEVNPDALAIADSLDEERQTRGPRGILHGIPVLVKDNIGTADRLHTSAGSSALSGSFAPRDAFLVERLRAAGAIILGKANMSEWANARGRNSIGGWSGRGGLTRNPYALDRSAGGSSAGTAAAVSANLAPVAIGTETMGSVVSPSAMCGIVGMKPTVGLVSRAGLIPVSYTQDTAGPMGRTVRDVAVLLSAMAASDPRDAATAESTRRAVPDYTAALDPNGLEGARIGVARNLFGLSLHADRVARRALEVLRAGGAVLVDPADIETTSAIWTFDAEVLSFELKASLNEYLASGRRRLPEHHRARGGRGRAPHRTPFLRRRLERGDPAPDRLRLRAADPGPPRSDLPGVGHAAVLTWHRSAARGAGRPLPSVVNPALPFTPLELGRLDAPDPSAADSLCRPACRLCRRVVGGERPRRPGRARPA
jgi:amidase